MLEVMVARPSSTATSASRRFTALSATQPRPDRLRIVPRKVLWAAWVPRRAANSRVDSSPSLSAGRLWLVFETHGDRLGSAIRIEGDRKKFVRDIMYAIEIPAPLEFLKSFDIGKILD